MTTELLIYMYGMSLDSHWVGKKSFECCELWKNYTLFEKLSCTDHTFVLLYCAPTKHIAVLRCGSSSLKSPNLNVAQVVYDHFGQPMVGNHQTKVQKRKSLYTSTWRKGNSDDERGSGVGHHLVIILWSMTSGDDDADDGDDDIGGSKRIAGR